MLQVIDNYDSFTWNLVHFLGELGAKLDVVRNDTLSADDVLRRNPEAIILSPGPCTPNEAGICLEVVRQAQGQIPILGVCLGHQAIAQAYGGVIEHAPVLMHGKLSPINHGEGGLFNGLPNPFSATRYHSLSVQPESLPDCFQVTARADPGLIMGIAHREHPVAGVQFHPESIATEHGHALLRNFLNQARQFNEKSGRKSAA